MAFLSVHHVNISGISACVPRHSVSNMDYERISVKERELLVKTTGIEKRRIAEKDVCTSDMCLASANALLDQMKVDRSQIEIVILVSQSPDYFLPATSIILQDKLGLPKSTMAFDIQLGCSGYVYGLSVISSLIGNGKLKKGLLLVGDKSSFSQSEKDKSTYPIFGDAGTATLLEYDEHAAPMHFNLQSDGAGYRSIIITEGGTRNPYGPQSEEWIEPEPGILKKRKHLILDGVEVFNFSLREAPPNVAALLEYAQTSVADYDHFLFHQANRLMNESIRKKLKVPAEKTPYSLQEYGNTSSASIPLTMVTQLSEQLKGKKSSLLLSAFGVGLSWGSASIQVNDLICLPLIEI